MNLHLRDKVVLITGSSRGIGVATARAFGAEGCRLVLSPRSASALTGAEANLRAGGAKVHAKVADVTKPDQAAQLVEAARTAFGGIDILINNVGGGQGGVDLRHRALGARIWPIRYPGQHSLTRLHLDRGQRLGPLPKHQSSQFR